jgi:hypothetical protein
MSGRFSGMNLLMARRQWKWLKGSVEDKHATGEEVYRHRLLERPITVNKRKKSAPRHLTNAIRKLYALLP